MSRSGADRVLLLSGLPGVGKTTAVRKVAAALARHRLRGFTTEEVRVRGRRQGFRLETLDGHVATLAHTDIRSSCRVGRYGVDIDALNRIVDLTLHHDASVELYVVDEIGKMECLSQKFVCAMESLLDSEARILATIPVRGTEFIRRVRRHPAAKLWEITRENRDEIPGRVLDWVGR
ncbi:MAG: AAA family ATPase [Candidatus Eiseniibacteriota bacterium]|nr:MAG: AAA family ATPase [Candidatus Eisenbacteria bacterium]